MRGRSELHFCSISGGGVNEKNESYSFGYSGMLYTLFSFLKICGYVTFFTIVNSECLSLWVTNQLTYLFLCCSIYTVCLFR